MINSGWEAIHSKREWGRTPSEGMMLFFHRYCYLMERPLLRILEIGCGVGANLWYLAREGCQVYGIDGSSSAIAKAKDTIAHYSERWCGELCVGDMCDLPYENESFHIIIDVEGASSLESREAIRAYQEAHRVLIPNGLMFVQTLATGTDPGVIAEGTFTRISTQEEIAQITCPPFKMERIEGVSGNRADTGQSVNEWLLTLRK